MSHLSRRFLYLILTLGTGLVTACGSIPTSGPSALQIQSASTRQPSANAAGIQIVDVTDEVARRLFVNRAKSNFYVTFGGSTVFQQQLGIGDQLEISIWEAPPLRCSDQPSRQTQDLSRVIQKGLCYPTKPWTQTERLAFRSQDKLKPPAGRQASCRGILQGGSRELRMIRKCL